MKNVSFKIFDFQIYCFCARLAQLVEQLIYTEKAGGSSPSSRTKIKMEPKVLYEDDNYLIINKPAGLMVHPDGKENARALAKGVKASKEKTLVDWILKKYPTMKNVGEPMQISGANSPGRSDETEDSDEKIIHRPGIVHRLDRETSGVLVLAKNQQAFEDLKKKFQNREVQKIYHTIVAGILKDNDGLIDKPIGRSARDFRQWSAGRGARGEMREAVTRWNVIARGKKGESDRGGIEATLIEAIPKTGRTHQIRAHLKSINHPIIGDSLYAPKFLAMAVKLGLKRVALHSYSISFKGLNGKKISARAPYPSDFDTAVKKLRK